MPRIARGLKDGFVYHVLNRGNGKQKVFHKNQDYKAFIALMIEAKKRYDIKILAYCLMPNHFHIVVMPSQAEDLSKWMQWLMTSHVRRYHHHYGTSGHVWQGRFKSFIVQEDNYLITLLRYVEANPVRAGMVNSAIDWKWSSYFYRERKNDIFFSLIDSSYIKLPENWNEYVNRFLGEEDENKILQSIQRQSPYGEKMWQIKISKKLGLEYTLRPKGRPKGVRKK